MYLWNAIDPFWAAISIASIAVLLLLAAVTGVRRLRLAFSQMNIWLNGAWALGITGILVIAILALGKITTGGYFEFETYTTLALWLWQIPVGIFIGRGLSWAIVDRKISGVVSVDDRNLEDGGHEHDHHYH